MREETHAYGDPEEGRYRDDDERRNDWLGAAEEEVPFHIPRD